MFQGRYFLGIWQIHYAAKGSLLLCRSDGKIKCIWTSMNMACVNRASSKKLLRNTWILVMTFNINRAKSVALTSPLSFSQGIETIPVHLWFFKTRKIMSKNTGKILISKLIWIFRWLKWEGLNTFQACNFLNKGNSSLCHEIWHSNFICSCLLKY